MGEEYEWISNRLPIYQWYLASTNTMSLTMICTNIHVLDTNNLLVILDQMEIPYTVLNTSSVNYKKIHLYITDVKSIIRDNKINDILND